MKMNKAALVFSALAMTAAAPALAKSAKTPGQEARDICRDLKKTEGYVCPPAARLRIAALVEEFRARPEPATDLDAETAYHEAENRLRGIMAANPSAGRK